MKASLIGSAACGAPKIARGSRGVVRQFVAAGGGRNGCRRIFPPAAVSLNRAHPRDRPLLKEHGGVSSFADHGLNGKAVELCFWQGAYLLQCERLASVNYRYWKLTANF
jgi:hypothetical protein